MPVLQDGVSSSLPSSFYRLDLQYGMHGLAVNNGYFDPSLFFDAFSNNPTYQNHPRFDFLLLHQSLHIKHHIRKLEKMRSFLHLGFKKDN